VAAGRLAVGLTRPVLAHHAQGLHTLLLRKEKLCAVFPDAHRLARSHLVQWRQIADEPLIILARREGVGLHEAILAACRHARFTPTLAYTPSLIGTVLNYVEAGAGVGVIPDSVSSLGERGPLVFRMLAPTRCVDLVMVWSDKDEPPAASAFRNLVAEWKSAGLLWRKKA